GEKVGATDAADWGLIHRCVTEVQLDATADDLLTRLAAGPTVAIGLTKQAIHSAQNATLSQAMSQELFNVELSSRTGDFKEGLTAFRERRSPLFEGR
ncbi:MAG: 2-(1,2-epoxy,2-dihydrophenyl)acetyl-CoA isomerase, partial [Mycobacterium sp.]|nr:2-(1,2-epoxy,2-dihydrophenyl)acetyl-CoA isomerase [Mycobacterium sp.]